MNAAELVEEVRTSGYATTSVETAEAFYRVMHEVAELAGLKSIPHPRRPGKETSLAPQTEVAMDPHSELGRTPFRCAVVGFLGVQQAEIGGETVLVDTSIEAGCGAALAELLPETLRFRGLVAQAALPEHYDLAAPKATQYGRITAASLHDDGMVEFEYAIPTVVSSAIAPGVLSAATSLTGPYSGALDSSTGAPISAEVVEKARAIMAEHSVVLRLDEGDVVIIDNCRTLHGRSAYSGERVIVSALLSQFGSAFE